ncbi:MAG: hypothetical protein R6X34_27300 [Chloroflexota bacterium]
MVGWSVACWLRAMQAVDETRTLDASGRDDDARRIAFLERYRSGLPSATSKANRKWRGLARALLLTGLRLLQERGLDTAVLGTSSDNEAMLGTARSVGFEVHMLPHIASLCHSFTDGW